MWIHNVHYWWMWSYNIDRCGLTLLIDVDLHDWLTWTYNIDGCRPTWLMDVDLHLLMNVELKYWWVWTTYNTDECAVTLLMDLDLRDWWVVNESWKLVVMCQIHQSDEIQDWKTKLNIIGTCTLNFISTDYTSNP